MRPITLSTNAVALFVAIYFAILSQYALEVEARGLKSGKNRGVEHVGQESKRQVHLILSLLAHTHQESAASLTKPC